MTEALFSLPRLALTFCNMFSLITCKNHNVKVNLKFKTSGYGGEGGGG